MISGKTLPWFYLLQVINNTRIIASNKVWKPMNTYQSFNSEKSLVIITVREEIKSTQHERSIDKIINNITNKQKLKSTQ